MIAISGKIKIGCEEHTASEWVANYKKIGEDNGYTGDEIAEYYRYIELCAAIAKAKG